MEILWNTKKPPDRDCANEGRHPLPILPQDHLPRRNTGALQSFLRKREPGQGSAKASALNGLELASQPVRPMFAILGPRRR